MATAIEFNNISKQYRLGMVSTRTLSHDLDRWWKMNVLGKEDPYLKIGSVNDRTSAADSEYVWALKNIDFKVEQGDVIGIIGRNGAGKSTLLKLLSGITAPTTGTINAMGRIGALLEVGTGFHPEMTGRENIYLNGAIMGMSKQEISKKLDEIVDFSGCERYIDTPVKRYSSGMTVRLGFAVAAHLEPEILVVDEVLAVGDAEFQKKAIGKMQDVSRGEGRTVLFVSHNMDSILNLCNNGVLLQNGQVKYIGDIKSTVMTYLDSGSDCTYRGKAGQGPAYIEDAHFLGSYDNRTGSFTFDENIKISVTVRKTDAISFNPQAVLSIFIRTIRNVSVCNYEIPLDVLADRDQVTFGLKYPSSLFLSGRYKFSMCIHIPNVCFYDRAEACAFTIVDGNSEFAKYQNADNGLIKIAPETNVLR